MELAFVIKTILMFTRLDAPAFGWFGRPPLLNESCLFLKGWEIIQSLLEHDLKFMGIWR